MPGVGDDESPVVDQHAGGQMHSPFWSAAAGCRALRLTVRLAQHHIGILLVALGDAVPDQYAVVAGIGDHQMVVVQEHPAR